MYLNQKAKTQSERCFTYDLSRGIENSFRGQLGKVVSAENLSSGLLPSISPRGRFYRCDYPNDAISVGNYSDIIYYNTADGFYFDGERRGDLTEGKKTFVNFSGRVYIFPDRAYYDVESDTLVHLAVAVTGTISVRESSARNCYMASYVTFSSGNLAEAFRECESIEITGTKDGMFDGCYTISDRNVDSGVIYFGYCENLTGNSSETETTITNGVPALEGACVCKNRIFGYAGNKIYACAFGDGTNWCDLDDESGCYRYENVGGDDFSACDTMEDQCVFFTEDKIFKIYGENVRELSPKLMSGYGGIEAGLADAHARVLGDVYFLNRDAIIKFSGTISETVCRLNENDISSGACFPYRNKLYFYYHADSGERLCVFDVEAGALYRIGISGVKGFLDLNGNVCVMTDSEIVALEGKGDRLPEGFVRDADISSHVEFNEIHNGYDRFSPVRLYVRGEVMSGGEVDIYCMLGNSGEWSEVHKLVADGERLWEFSLPASLTTSFRLRLEGRGDYVINDIYVLFS